MQSGDLFQLAATTGRLLELGQRQVFVQELTLQEVRAMRAEAKDQAQARAEQDEKAAIPRWDGIIKEVLRWGIPGGVLWATGSLEKALAALQVVK